MAFVCLSESSDIKRNKLINVDNRICYVADFESQFYNNPIYGFNYSDLELKEKVLPVYIETDYYTYQDFNYDSIAVKNWIYKIFKNVKTIYKNEGINILLSEVKIPASPGWASNIPENDIFQYLSTFGGNVKNKTTARLNHFITTRWIGGGIAWVDVLCLDYFSWVTTEGDTIHAGPYAVSGSLEKTFPDYPVYSWNVSVFAHEMGHNIKSRHTHDCVWGPSNDRSIDICIDGGCVGTYNDPGTIMSYCHLFGNGGIDLVKGFGELPGDLIRSAVASAGCLNCLPSITVADNLTTDITAQSVEVVNGAQIDGPVVNTNTFEIIEGEILSGEINITNCSE